MLLGRETERGYLRKQQQTAFDGVLLSLIEIVKSTKGEIVQQIAALKLGSFCLAIDKCNAVGRVSAIQRPFQLQSHYRFNLQHTWLLV